MSKGFMSKGFMSKAMICSVLAFLMLVSAAAYARSVTMSLAFNITNKDNIIRANDTLYNTIATNATTMSNVKKFISSERNGTLAGLVFAGTDFLSISLNTTYSANHYLMQLSQDDNSNRFIIPVANGTWESIDARLGDIDRTKIMGSAFGNIFYAVPKAFDFFIRLEYRNVDIINNVRFDGSTSFFMKNAGKSGKLSMINVSVIR